MEESGVLSSCEALATKSVLARSRLRKRVTSMTVSRASLFGSEGCSGRRWHRRSKGLSSPLSTWNTGRRFGFASATHWQRPAWITTSTKGLPSREAESGRSGSSRCAEGFTARMIPRPLRSRTPSSSLSSTARRRSRSCSRPEASLLTVSAYSAKDLVEALRFVKGGIPPQGFGEIPRRFAQAPQRTSYPPGNPKGHHREDPERKDQTSATRHATWRA